MRRLSKAEQLTAYKQCVDMIMSNTRYVLDNLEFFPQFEVDWEDYHKKGYKRPPSKTS